MEAWEIYTNELMYEEASTPIVTVMEMEKEVMQKQKLERARQNKNHH